MTKAITQTAVLSQKLTLAKADRQDLNGLISEYMPFIKKCTSSVFFRGQARRDNLTEAMLGFIQSVKTYDEQKGAFIPYAQMVIRGRLINAAKKEAAVLKPLFSTAVKETQSWEYENAEQQHTELEARKDAQAEIAEINGKFAHLGFTWQDLLKNCPKQSRSRKSCHDIARKLLQDKPLLEEMLETGKLPIKRLCALTGYSEKIPEKYRRYILAIILIMKGDYPYIRSFLEGL